MKRRTRGDMLLLAATLALTCIGLIMITSSSYVMASETVGDRYFYLKRHLIYLVLALIAYISATNIPMQRLRQFSPYFFGVAVLLLVLTLVSPLGSSGGGASRWLKIAGFRFQPSEFARLSCFIFLSHWVTQQGERIRDFRRGLLMPLSVIAILSLLILSEPDFGTAVSTGLAGMIILYVAGARLNHLLPCLLLTIPGIIYAMLGSSYRRARLMTFLDPWKDPLDSGFQIIQSFIALRSGGFFGQGIGDGVQKFFYLPEAHTDFVLAVLGEELGFIGVFAVVALFALIVARGLTIAVRCEERFQATLAAGITFALGMQAFTNMAVVMGLLPTKGLTLPLLSFGGSSLIATYLAIGVLQNIARQLKRGEA